MSAQYFFFKREGSGSSTLAMSIVLLLAQLLHELGIEQYEYPWLCFMIAISIHFLWLGAVYMMTACTCLFFLSVTYPLETRMAVGSNRVRIFLIYALNALIFFHFSYYHRLCTAVLLINLI